MEAHRRKRGGTRAWRLTSNGLGLAKEEGQLILPLMDSMLVRKRMCMHCAQAHSLSSTKA